MVTMRILLASLLIVLLVGKPATAQTEVDLKLVLLVDASNSIDEAELKFQRHNLNLNRP